MRNESLRILSIAKTIAESYLPQRVTVRQLYYQFIARGLFDPQDDPKAANRFYQNLVNTLANGRKHGHFPMNLIEDRTRRVVGGSVLDHETNSNKPLLKIGDILLEQIPELYIKSDRWMGQEYFVSVMIEKEALVGVFEQPCEMAGVPLYVLRGYTSLSGIWGWLKLYQKAQNERIAAGFGPFAGAKVLYFGDHDPDGLEIPNAALSALEDLIWQHRLFDLHQSFRDTPTYKRRLIRENGKEDGSLIFRNIMNTLDEENDEHIYHHGFGTKRIEFVRCGINKKQIKELNAPPFAAKQTSSRYQAYVRKTGVKRAWELDALPSDYIANLVHEKTEKYFDEDIYKQNQERVQEGRNDYKRKLRSVLTRICANLEKEEAEMLKKEQEGEDWKPSGVIEAHYASLREDEDDDTNED